MAPAKNYQRIYTIAGALFGLIFPIAGTLIEIQSLGNSFTFSEVLNTQKNQPLLWIIDTAPFFLGLAAFFVGKRQEKIVKMNQRLLNTLSQSQFLNQSIINLANYAAVICDNEGVIISLNQGTTFLTGYSPEDLQTKSSILQFFLPSDIESRTAMLSQRLNINVKQGFQSLVAGLSAGEGEEFESHWVRKDGAAISVSVSANKVNEYLGLEEGYLFLARNITQQKKIEAALLDSERRIKQILEVIPVGIYVLNSDGKPYFANKKAVEILGKGIIYDASPNELAIIYNAYITGTSTSYPTSQMPIVRAMSGETSSIDNIQIKREHDAVELEIFGAPVTDPEGNIEFSIAAFTDISERKRTQRALTESEQTFRAIFDSASIGIILCNPEGVITRINNALGKILGIKIEKLIGMNLVDLVNPGNIEILNNGIQQLTGGIPGAIDIILEFQSHEKKIIWGQTYLSAIRDSKNRVINLVVLLEDITFRKESEEMQQKFLQSLQTLNEDLNIYSLNLKQMHSVLTTAFKSETEQMEAILQTGCSVFGTDYGTTLQVSGKKVTITGTNFQTEQFKPGMEFNLDESFAGIVEKRRETIILNNIGSDEELRKAVHYQKFKVEAYVSTPIHVNGVFYGVLSFFSLKPRAIPFKPRDSEYVELLGSALSRMLEMGESRAAIEKYAEKLKKSNDELQKSNVGLDQFAYVVSHDLKAPLRGINSLAEWIQEDLGDHIQKEVNEKLQLLRNRVQRLSSLIDGILEYSKIGRTQIEPARMDVGLLLNEVIDFISPSYDCEIRVHKPLPFVLADKTELSRVFINLIGNALKYSKKGKVEIFSKKVGDNIAFCVKDNGPGIEPKYFEKIFGIFQRLDSRDEIEGTGIGLSIVKKIVEENGGNVWVESVMGHGSEFWFTWPEA